MSEIAIRVENLSKQYHIGGKQERYRTLRDTLTDAFVGPVRKLGGLLRGRATAAANLNETIWALKDISFEVKRGEVVGIIGRNGAGKSTLLKILSRITEPTKGRAEIHGRVGSLLEVGTGFHPELTGRENIYLNGAVLGMKRAEIDQKFDEIVAFAEVEKFIDTPVKHYSNGMYLRLAFAVAAHLEPEILAVDEVLAVGDVDFQKKCLGRMSEIGKGGRTVLFVSHNLGAISSLCTSAIVLDRGEIVAFGAADKMISRYVQMNDSQLGMSLKHRDDRGGDGRLRFTKVLLYNSLGQVVDSVLSGDDVAIGLRFEVRHGCELRSVIFRMYVSDQFGFKLFACSNSFVGQKFDTLSGAGIIRCNIPRLPLAEGEYFLDLTCIVDTFTYVDDIQKAAKIKVDRGNFFGTGYTYHQPSIYVDQSWCFHLTQTNSAG